MLIDAHQHFWDLTRGDYGWLQPSLTTLYRNYLPADVAPLRVAGNIGTSVLVQAAPTQAETIFLLDLAAHDPGVAGVVGWVDLLDGQAAEQIGVLARNSLFKGVRPMLNLHQNDWIASPANTAALDDAVAALVHYDLAFDALVRSQHLPYLLTFARRHPELRIVIDHGAKPPLCGTSEQWNVWKNHLIELARLPHVSCKLSGLITEAAPGADYCTLAPTVRFLLEQFGPLRLLWGSDWPVVNLNGDYNNWLAASLALLADCRPVERAAIFGTNAKLFYRLDLCASSSIF